MAENLHRRWMAWFRSEPINPSILFSWHTDKSSQQVSHMLSDEQFDKLSRYAEKRLAVECARLIAPYRSVVRQELREMMASPRRARPAQQPSLLRQLLGGGPIIHPGP